MSRRRNASESLSETHRRREADPDEPIEPMLIARARVGDEAAASALRIISRLNKKELSLERVAAAAECGHPGARLLRPDVAMTSGDGLPGLDLLDWRKQQLFAADCTETVLPIFERYFPDDHRVKEAISARRNWALGKRGSRKKWEAARDAAVYGSALPRMPMVRTPEWDAARDAASVAARAAGIIDVNAAVGDAAMAAATDAGWNAACIARGNRNRGTEMDPERAFIRASTMASRTQWNAQRLRLADYLVGDAP